MKLSSPKMFIGVFLCLSIVVFSCKKKTTTATTTTTTTTAACSGTISYSATIAPMMSQNCSTSGCHNSSNAGGYNLTTYSSVSSNAMIILKSMRHESGVNAMPQGASQIATSTLDKFDCWIQQGKLNN
jgi:hypothetical protein